MIVALSISVLVLAFVIGWQHRQIKQLRKKLEGLSGGQQAHQGLIMQLWRERIDIGEQIKALEQRDEITLHRIGREGAIWGQISGLWKRLEEVAPSRETVDA